MVDADLGMNMPSKIQPDGLTATVRSQVDDSSPFYGAPMRSEFSLGNRLARLCWAVVWLMLFRPSPVPFHAWRRMLLVLFGARIARTARVYSSARIWAPWMLEMREGSCIGPDVYCYDIGPVRLGVDATVSMGTTLCTASHDLADPGRGLVLGRINIGRGAWVFAEAFIGIDVAIGEGAVVGARAVVVRDVASYDIVAGNPARVIGRRQWPSAPGRPVGGAS
jgi:putative colanic acid biosynthesis acetyltransferase WcaF